MTDKKFTDEEIIRNYEWCIGCTSDRCRECTMDEEGFCEEELQDLVLDLINRQKEEIEDLKVELAAMRGAANSYKAEIKRLKGSVITNNIMESQRIKREAKSEAYKDFAEKLKQHKRKMRGFDLNEEFWDYAVLVENIDNLLKEMVGEEIL